ncbi:MucR family transcriptional regulator [Methylobacterium sp. J-088]|uniref:MucR family transcriptional regulator n=1 Tax=Methylobacterium sp. J-088 TaxID=2836664 RepID=UPI00391A1E9B
MPTFKGRMTVSREVAEHSPNFIELAGDIVAAYVANNSVPASELPNLIHSVYTAIGALTAAPPFCVT